MTQDVWDKRFMRLTDEISTWSSCIRRKVGAIIVKDNRIITTGYNGAPHGIEPCRDRNKCFRISNNIPSGQRQELCYAAHAEQNAIVQAAKLGSSIDGATLYCTHAPCSICARLIINSGIKRIVYCSDYPDEFATKLLEEANIEMEKFNGD